VTDRERNRDREEAAKPIFSRSLQVAEPSDKWTSIRLPRRQRVQAQNSNEKSFGRPAVVVPNLEYSREYAIGFHLR
jgi:hypothetical protein